WGACTGRSTCHSHRLRESARESWGLRVRCPELLLRLPLRKRHPSHPRNPAVRLLGETSGERVIRGSAQSVVPISGPLPGAKKKRRKDFTNARGHTINPPMNMEPRCILLVAPVAFVLANWLPNDVAAADLQEAKVTQAVQEVKVVPSGGAARPVVVNETVRQGNAVQTGTQSRSELTFKDETITRLGEKTIYTIG